MNMICEFFKVFPDRNIWPPGQRAEMRERMLLNHYRKSVQNFVRLQDMCG